VAKQDYEEKYTHPELRERIKEEIKASDKGGKEGQWSARKSQLLTQEYKKQGGYKGEKNQSQKDLEEWTEEDWQTKKARPTPARITARPNATCPRKPGRT